MSKLTVKRVLVAVAAAGVAVFTAGCGGGAGDGYCDETGRSGDCEQQPDPSFVPVDVPG